MNSKLLQVGLLGASMVMLGSAAIIWAGKTRSQPLAKTELAMPKAPTDRGVQLLSLSFRADSQLSYSAISHTEAWMGGQNIESTARITRAPRHLSVKVTAGALAGSQSGYSEHWLWRQNPGEEMKPYAEVALDADQMAARRFALMLKNYTVTWQGGQILGGRRAQVIELRPRRAIDGARGPARRLFIDEQNSLTLRVDAFNCALQPISRSTLSQIDLAPQITAATFEAPAAIKASLHNRDWQGEELAQDRAMAAQKTGFLPPQPKFLPPGFVLDGYGVHRCRTTGALQLSAFSRYTDGLNMLTVFAFKPSNSNIQKNMRGACNFGPGTMSSREDGGGRLVALSDLPSKTLQHVLVSAKFETAK